MASTMRSGSHDVGLDTSQEGDAFRRIVPAVSHLLATAAEKVSASGFNMRMRCVKRNSFNRQPGKDPDKMTNSTTTDIALPETKDAFLEYAAEGGGLFGELIKFVKGKWLHGDDEIPLGTEYVAEIDQLARGWVRWEDGKPVDHRLGFVRDGKKIAKREDLAFNDKSEWEKDQYGKPKDPWQEQGYLPLVHCETDENFCWVISSYGAKKASQKLSLAYFKRGLSQLPIISLRADRYKHATYGWTDIPILKVERWQSREGMAPASVPAPAPKLPLREDPISSGLPAKAEATADNADLNDEIVF